MAQKQIIPGKDNRGGKRSNPGGRTKNAIPTRTYGRRVTEQERKLLDKLLNDFRQKQSVISVTRNTWKKNPKYLYKIDSNFDLVEIPIKGCFRENNKDFYLEFDSFRKQLKGDLFETKEEAIRFQLDTCLYCYDYAKNKEESDLMKNAINKLEKMLLDLRNTKTENQ